MTIAELVQAGLFRAAGSVDRWGPDAIGFLLVVLGVAILAAVLLVAALRSAIQ
jgi:hypothetical protein